MGIFLLKDTVNNSVYRCFKIVMLLLNTNVIINETSFGYIKKAPLFNNGAFL